MVHIVNLVHIALNLKIENSNFSIMSIINIDLFDSKNFPNQINTFLNTCTCTSEWTYVTGAKWHDGDQPLLHAPLFLTMFNLCAPQYFKIVLTIYIGIYLCCSIPINIPLISPTTTGSTVVAVVKEMPKVFNQGRRRYCKQSPLHTDTIWTWSRMGLKIWDPLVPGPES